MLLHLFVSTCHNNFYVYFVAQFMLSLVNLLIVFYISLFC